MKTQRESDSLNYLRNYPFYDSDALLLGRVDEHAVGRMAVMPCLSITQLGSPNFLTARAFRRPRALPRVSVGSFLSWNRHLQGEMSAAELAEEVQALRREVEELRELLRAGRQTPAETSDESLSDDRRSQGFFDGRFHSTSV